MTFQFLCELINGYWRLNCGIFKKWLKINIYIRYNDILVNLNFKVKRELDCCLSGYPKPSIKWYRNNVEIHSSRTTKMEFDGSKVKLTIPNVQTSDSDSYKCVAENEAGQDQIKANVSVIGEEILLFTQCSWWSCAKNECSWSCTKYGCSWSCKRNGCSWSSLYKKWMFMVHSILHYLYWYLCCELSLNLNSVI